MYDCLDFIQMFCILQLNFEQLISYYCKFDSLFKKNNKPLLLTNTFLLIFTKLVGMFTCKHEVWNYLTVHVNPNLQQGLT